MNKNILCVILSTVMVGTVSANAPVYSPASQEARIQKLEKMLNARSQIDTYAKVNKLEHEVRTLNGVIEELNHKIERLEKRQTQFAVDFDNRLNQAVAKPQAFNKQTNSTENNKVDTRDGGMLSEEGAYQNAYQLVKAGDYSGALRAFRAFLELYPSQRYAVNAHYWLGELYLAKQDYKQSEKEFMWIVDKHKEHRKAPDALVKLGFLHFESGDVVKSKNLFTQVIEQYPKSSAASLARAKLQTIRVN